MIVKVGSIVKVTYRGIWDGCGWQTGVIGSCNLAGWLSITYLTPQVNAYASDAHHIGIGETRHWSTDACLACFDLEVLEEGDGQKMSLWRTGRPL